MSKYHKGDKFIVEIKEVMNSDNGTLYRSDFKTLTFDDNGLDKLKKYEELSSDTKEMLEMKAYNKGLKDAWELAKKIASNPSEGGFSIKELIKIFESSLIKDIFKKYSAQEALVKLEAYENEQADIKVGDVVYIPGIANEHGEDDVEAYGVVTSIYRNNHYEILMKNGDGITVTVNAIEKIGKNIDIQSLLDSISK